MGMGVSVCLSVRSYIRGTACPDFTKFPVLLPNGKSGPKDQVALHYYYTSPSHWCTTHEVSKL